MKKASILLVALAMALFGLAACGDDEEEEGDDAIIETTTSEDTTAAAGGAGGTLNVSTAADAGIAYDQTELQTVAGSVTINYNNQAPLSHDVVIEDQDGAELGKTDLISQGEASTTVELVPGTYTFYCDVPGHREDGMEGTLTVK